MNNTNFTLIFILSIGIAVWALARFSLRKKAMDKQEEGENQSAQSHKPTIAMTVNQKVLLGFSFFFFALFALGSFGIIHVPGYSDSFLLSYMALMGLFLTLSKSIRMTKYIRALQVAYFILFIASVITVVVPTNDLISNVHLLAGIFVLISLVLVSGKNTQNAK
jgi:hypothetical protein